MASRKSYLSKPSYIFAETHFNNQKSPPQEGGVLELDEADLWNSWSQSPATEALKKGSPRSGLKRSGARKVVDAENTGGRPGPGSLPVSIPDWSKILKQDYKEHRKWNSDDEDDDDEDGDEEHLPPHEYLARTRGASLSVHEGIGRTLKGRDLRSVRNAIWKKVGFED